MASTMTLEQAIIRAHKFTQDFENPRISIDRVRFSMELGYSEHGDIDLAYSNEIQSATFGGTYAAAYAQGYEIRPEEMGNSALFINRLPAKLVVDTFSSALDAGTRATLIQQIESGKISSNDFALGLSLALINDATPSATQITDSLNAFKNGEFDSGSNPGPITELTDVHLDFLTGVYVGSFLRAPEYEGFTYWASYLKELLNMGLGRDGAFNSIAATMQQAGAEHGEKGTGLSSSDYVSFVYDNVLGRAPDADGHAYWVRGLDSGEIGRSQFLAAFLTAANEHSSDAEFIASRTAVAKFAAQEHVSGPQAPGNNIAFLQSVLDGVTNPATAQAKLNQLINDFGAAPAQQSQFKMLLSSWAEESPADQMFIDTPEDEAITLVGIASAGAGDTVDFF